MKVTVDRLSADQIRAQYNSCRDGTMTDALRRHRCMVALGERCIGDDMPGGLRYPTADEIREARREIARAINEGARS